MTLKKQNKILFLVNGFGLGNCTRSEAIMTELTKIGYQISIGTSNNGLTFFQSTNHSLFKLKSLKYGQSNNKFNLLKTFFLLPQIGTRLLSNFLTLTKILKNNSFAAIVSDSDYMIAGLLFIKSVPPLVAINNSTLVIDFLKKETLIPKSIRGQLLIEKLDAFFHRNIPDLVISPSLFENSLLPKNTRAVPPIVRDGFNPCLTTTKVKKILVMLSGSELKTNLNALLDSRLNEFEIAVIGQNNLSKKNIKNIKPSSHNLPHLQEADLIVINAGFSSISEAYCLQKPVVILPIPNHAEQYANAKLVEKIGFGLVATESDLADKIIESVQNYKYLYQSFLTTNFKLSGAYSAASLIHQMILMQKQSVFTQPESFRQVPPETINLV